MEVTKKLKTLLNILNPFFSKMDCNITFDVDAYNHQVQSGNHIYCSEGRVALPIDISKELDVRGATLRAMVEFMVDKGYLEEIEYGAGCAGCRLNGKCSTPASGERKMKMYALTKETMDYIKDA